MTREELARKSFYDGTHDFNDGKSEYFRGIEWADQHPREGLWDAEKVKQFLRDNTMFGNHPVVFKKFIKSLTQYMEE